MRLFWITAALLVLSSPSSALFATLINLSPTLAKLYMFGLGALGPTFITTGLVYFLGRHFGGSEIRPKFKKPVKPADRFDFAPPDGAQDDSSYSYYSPEESQYAEQSGQYAYVESKSQDQAVEEGAPQAEESQYAEQSGQFAYVESRSQDQTVEEVALQVEEQAPQVEEQALSSRAARRFGHPRGRRMVSRS